MRCIQRRPPPLCIVLGSLWKCVHAGISVIFAVIFSLLPAVSPWSGKSADVFFIRYRRTELLRVSQLSALVLYAPMNREYIWFLVTALEFGFFLGLLGIRKHYITRITTVQCESKKIPPKVFWHFFPNGSEFLGQILHAYYTFLSTLDYKFLFN